MELSVIAPCYNEEGNISELVDRVMRVFTTKGIAGELILVNDASVDRTQDEIDTACRKYPDKVVGIRHSTNLGMASGWRSGVEAARGEYVCIIDADLQYLPEDVWRLYREIKFSCADIIQGWRSHVGRLKDSRMFLSRVLNLLLNILFGMQLKDNKSGFILCKREVLSDVLRYRYKYRCFQTLLAIAAAGKGYSIREVETLFMSRFVGSSFIPSFPLKFILFTFWDIVKGVFEFRLLHNKHMLLEEFLSKRRPLKSEPEMPVKSKKYMKGPYLSLRSISYNNCLTRNVREYFDELQQSQWLSPDELRELQDQKLICLIQHSYNHVPYYRERFKELGLTPGDIRSIDDLPRLSVLTKEKTKKHIYFDLMSDNYHKKRLLEVTTCGLENKPMVYYADKFHEEYNWTTALRATTWAGYQPGDKLVYWMMRYRNNRYTSLIDKFLTGEHWLAPVGITEADLDRFAKLLLSSRTCLIGYAELLFWLAKAEKFKGKGRPRAIICVSQTLDENERRLIEERFGCKVYLRYGTKELGVVAQECEAQTGYHTAAESYIVEILKEDGQAAQPGEEGKLVITDLNNYYMPLIRYQVEDYAISHCKTKTCSCGRGLPLIGHVRGRPQQIFFGAEGEILSSMLFSNYFMDYSYVISRYKIIQNTPDCLQLELLKAPRFTQNNFDEMMAGLRCKIGLGRHTRIDVKFSEQ